MELVAFTAKCFVVSTVNGSGQNGFRIFCGIILLVSETHSHVHGGLNHGPLTKNQTPLVLTINALACRPVELGWQDSLTRSARSIILTLLILHPSKNAWGPRGGDASWSTWQSESSPDPAPTAAAKMLGSCPASAGISNTASRVSASCERLHVSA